jgi:hypothetical protein
VPAKNLMKIDGESSTVKGRKSGRTKAGLTDNNNIAVKFFPVQTSDFCETE